ncbi:hypothetical protein ABI_31450 [Asticcacaulis biprosthecium C19]|uniref:Uncharacterized protein n=1 Tax=Asticcacaulis biprosthecium C19 TaxID=715226 RepID=F4QRK6_9CAUL|nr:DUF805 domain-containing protein [Asticcacaulis biprosthecium]EGF90132.1 hypothetical protein ABI_31450 [Asticcacaulis biprosthecium C19]
MPGELGAVYYLEYFLYIFGPVIVFVGLAAALAAAAVLGRPEGRNRFGPVPRVLAVPHAVVTVYRKTADFSGRASRSEIWPWLLATFGVQLAILFLLRHDLILAGSVAALLWIPGVSAGARRLHDLNLSARWLVIALTVVGLLALGIMWLVPSQQPNESDVSDFFE